MRRLLRSGPRHPLFETWRTTRAAKASGLCVAASGAYREWIAAASRGVTATHALFPVLRQGGDLLTTHERDQLWERWQVPVYALVLDNTARVVAYECEAQEGLHVSGWVPDCGRLESTP